MNHPTTRSSRTLLTLAAAACIALPAAAFAQSDGNMSTSGGAAGATSHNGVTQRPNGNGDQPKGSKPRSGHMREASPSSSSRRSHGSRHQMKQRPNGNGNQPNGSKPQGDTTEQATPSNTTNQ